MRTSPHFLPIALAILASTPSKAADPTARDLIALAPVVSSADETLKSIEIAGYNASEGRITRTFRLLYQAPGRFAFLTSDGVNGIPITFAVDRNMLIYDPVRPEVVYYTDTIEHHDWGVEDGKVKTSFDRKFWSHDSNRIVLDFKAMFAAADEDGSPTRDTVLKTSDTQYTLIKKHKKFYLRSRVDLTRACPFTTLEYSDGPNADANYCIDKVVINGALNPAEFAFPPKERLAGKVNVREVSVESLGNEFDAGVLWVKTFSVRNRLHEPPLRRGLIGPALMGVRWGRVEENDRIYGPLLKGVVPAAPAHTLAGRPAKKDDPDTIRQTNLEKIREHIPSSPIKIRLKIR